MGGAPWCQFLPHARPPLRPVDSTPFISAGMPESVLHIVRATVDYVRFVVGDCELVGCM